jgi:nucleoside-diphosphate-sugar epimerase
VVELIGRTALVTGAGTGIGEAIARRLVADGARVCAVGRTAKTLETLVTSLPEGAAVSVVADVANRMHHSSPDRWPRSTEVQRSWMYRRWPSSVTLKCISRTNARLSTAVPGSGARTKAPGYLKNS